VVFATTDKILRPIGFGCKNKAVKYTCANFFLRFGSFEEVTNTVQELKNNKKRAYLFVLSQLLLTLLFAVAYLTVSATAATSAFKGGLIAVVVNVVFLLLAFKHDAATQPDYALGAIQRGLSLKLMLAALLMAVVLQNKQTEAEPLLLTYVAVVILQCFKGFFFKH
jgi:F0F1-type ATP synthase assembly protein I